MTTREYGKMKRHQIKTSRRAIRGGVYVLGQIKRYVAQTTGRSRPVLSTEYRSEPPSAARDFRAFYGDDITGL